MDNTPAKRRILHGAKAIARYIGDESLSVALRHHSNEWPLFLIGNIQNSELKQLRALISRLF
jgi:hypothetical protein